ncbi:GNAT family acetyltransferase [Salinisphaera aquimarina]
MDEITLRAFRPADTEAVVALWSDCGLTRPWNDPYKDIARKLSVDADLFIVAEMQGTLVASVMAGYEGHRGWINYLAVTPSRQRLGIGRRLMDHAEQLLIARGCPKISLLIRRDNTAALAFYQQLGFGEDAAIPLGKRLEADD